MNEVVTSKTEPGKKLSVGLQSRLLYLLLKCPMLQNRGQGCVCSEPISDGESYWDTAAGDVCCDCLDGMTAADFLEDVCCEKINIATKD